MSLEWALLTPLGAGMYGIHPALPSYLADHWRVEDPDTYAEHRAAADDALLDAHAALATRLKQQIRTGDAALAFALIDRQRRTLSQMLGIALDNGYWDRAQAIAATLGLYWNRRGLNIEARCWVDRARLVVEDPDGTPPNLSTSAGALWLFIVGSEADHQQNAGQFDDAEATHAQIREMLLAQPTSPQLRAYLATNYHRLGVIAQLRGRLDDAEDRHRKSLTIAEGLGDRPGMARSYHQLGMLAQSRGRLGEAEDWYRKSLTLFDELGDRPGMADSYHKLGMLAELRGRLGEAEDWYRKSLTIFGKLGDRLHMAGSYHQLGIVAQLRGRLGEAEDWYRKSLTIFGEFGDRLHMAASYHQLGNVAQLRGRLGDAEDWYRKSLTLKEELGDRPGTVISFGQLGLLAEATGRPRDALEWMVRCVTVFDEFPHPLTGPGPQHLVRLTAALGVDVLRRCWLEVTGHEPPPAVISFLASSQAGES